MICTMYVFQYVLFKRAKLNWVSNFSTLIQLMHHFSVIFALIIPVLHPNEWHYVKIVSAYTQLHYNGLYVMGCVSSRVREPTLINLPSGTYGIHGPLH